MTVMICFMTFVLAAQTKTRKWNAKTRLISTEEYIELAQEFEALAKDRPFTDFYFNSACYWSLVGEKNKAIKCLHLAADEGFRFVEWIINEDDLSSLHRNRQWQIILKKVKINKRKYKLSEIPPTKASAILIPEQIPLYNNQEEAKLENQ